jgi:hypothetical protein
MFLDSFPFGFPFFHFFARVFERWSARCCFFFIGFWDSWGWDGMAWSFLHGWFVRRLYSYLVTHSVLKEPHIKRYLLFNALHIHTSPNDSFLLSSASVILRTFPSGQNLFEMSDLGLCDVLNSDLHPSFIHDSGHIEKGGVRHHKTLGIGMQPIAQDSAETLFYEIHSSQLTSCTVAVVFFSLLFSR